MNRYDRLAVAAALLTLAAGAASAATETAPPADRATSAPPADVRVAASPKRAVLAAPAGLAAHRIDLVRPSREELATLARPKSGPLAIGIPRSVPAATREIALRDLTWATTASGSRVAHVDVTSPGAAATRVAVSMDRPLPGMVVRFSGSAGTYGDVTASEVASAPGGLYWSPDLSGETATIEVEVPAAADLDAVTIRVPRVSHLVVGGADLASPNGAIARATGIGTAGACNVDLACVSPVDAAAVELAKSVARITFVDAGHTYLCSATIINDSTSSNTPYMWTANHCVSSQASASTVNAYFFFSAATCNNKATPPYVQLPGGGKLLGRSQDNDWVLLRLVNTPPAGSKLAAWRSDVLSTGASVVSLHHPSGDLLKYSKGGTTGLVPLADDQVNGTFTEVVWSQGVTEGGSSGGLVATLSASGAFYELRGGLYGGISACDLPKEPDYFSHLDVAFPVLRPYLTPNADMQGKVVAVEFYNAALDHYFISTNPVEIDNLDSGRTVGWVRTGLRFLVYATPAAGTSPVCRFYRAPAFGDSHFYSASPAECAATAANHPVDWIYESPNVFYVQLPNTTTGVCPSGTTAVYRFFNIATTNHRYTTERFLRDEMDTSPLWTPEGYGPGPYYPIMCAEMT
ncbi:MAG: trypsin-like peptidase domain-containing protein [Burkholderiales bacterium]